MAPRKALHKREGGLRRGAAIGRRGHFSGRVLVLLTVWLAGLLAGLARTVSRLILRASTGLMAAFVFFLLTTPPAVSQTTPPTFRKGFAPSAVVLGRDVTSRMVFTIENDANAAAVTGLAFTDNFANDLRIAGAGGVSNSCGGTVTAPFDGASISLSGGTVGANATCTVEVTVRPLRSGALVNTSGDLTSSAGNSGTASATLLVGASPLRFTKAFSPATVAVGGVSTLTFTIGNVNEFLGSFDFSDTLPAGVQIAPTPNITDSCPTAAVNAPANGTVIEVNGNVFDLDNCTVSVDVVGITAGTKVNTTSQLVSFEFGNSDPASATLVVTSAPDPGTPAFSKAFAPATIAVGASSTLTFTIDNSANAASATSVAFSDTLPTGVQIAPTPNIINGCGGTVTAPSNGATISYASGTVGANATCTVAVDVVGITAGTKVNTSGDLTSSAGNSGTASATLQVGSSPPAFRKGFAPSAVVLGRDVTSRMVFTIENDANAAAVTGLAFTDNFANDLRIAGAGGVSNSCGGTVTAPFDGASISLSGGTVGANATCTVEVTVRPLRSGALVNTSGDLTSSAGNSGTASATLLVGASPLRFTKAFSPATVAVGGVSTLTFTIGNVNEFLGSFDFSDTLPAGVQIAPTPNITDSCPTAAVNAPANGTVIEVNGNVFDLDNCTVSVDVVGITAGTKVNTTSELVSFEFGNSDPASATLVVTSAPPAFSKAFAPATIAVGASSTLTFTIDNSANAASATSVAFSDTLPTGVQVAAAPNTSNTCGGTLSASAAATTISLSNGSVGASTSCTLSVDVVGITAGTKANTSGDLTSSAGNSDPASATLVVTSAPDPGTPTFSKAFAPATIAVGVSSRLVFTIDNSANAASATSVAFSDTLPTGVQIAGDGFVFNDCGGTVDAPFNGASISLSGGTVDANATCTVDVDVVGITAGTKVNTSGDLTSSLGNSGPASAILVVTSAPDPGAPAFSKAFAPATIAVGASSTLTFTISEDSDDETPATSLAFSDTLPTGVQIAPTPNIINDCGGTVTAESNGPSISLSGGTVDANATCRVAVDVVGITAGTKVNTSGDLTSSLGNSGPAAAILVVTSAPDPKLTIKKSVMNGDGTTAFNFTSSPSIGTIDPLTPGAGSASASSSQFTLTADTKYDLTENMPLPQGWTFTDATCALDSGGGPLTSSPITNGVSVTPLAGQNITCTFNNIRQTGSITIEKNTEGAFGKFDFETAGPGLPAAFSLTTNAGNNPDDRTFSDLALGENYTITELVPDGWELKDIVCTAGGTRNNNSAGITLSNDNKDVRCTFTDFKKNDEAMEEETRRFIYRRVDNLLTHGPDRARMLRRLQDQAPRSVKDGPLKYSGSQSGGSLSSGGGGVVNNGGAMSLGSTLAHNSNNTLAGDGVPWMQDAFPSSSSMREDAFGTSTGPTSTSSSLFSSLASQLTPLAAGQTSFKFGTSLSEIRSKAAEAEASAQQKKLKDAGLSFAGQPYANPFLAPRPGFDIWVEGHISRYNDDIGGINREGDFRILYVGADYVLAPGVLVGALVQVDDTKEDINGSDRTGEIDGTGWMVGPYFGAKLLDNLFFDARAAWGQSDNDIWLNDTAAGHRTGSFDTDRWLATATLTGVHQHGAWRFSPELGLKYGHESYGTYTNSLGQTVRGADANIGRLTGGAEVAYRIQTGDGTIIEPMVGIEGIWNFDSDDLVINGVVQGTDDNRAKVEGGVLVRTPSGWGVRAAGNYDGIGGDDFNSYGGSLWVNVPLN